MAKFTRDELMEACRLSGGLISEVAARLGVHPSTVRRHLNMYPEAAAALETARKEIIDLAEAKLVKKIKEEFWPAIKFALKTLGRDRGYTEAIEARGTLSFGGVSAETVLKYAGFGEPPEDTSGGTEGEGA